LERKRGFLMMVEEMEKKTMYIGVGEVFAFVFGVELFSTTRNDEEFFGFMVGGRECISKESELILRWAITRYLLFKFKDLFTKSIVKSTLLLMEGVVFQKKIPEYLREEKAKKFIKDRIISYGEDILETSPLPMRTLEFLGNEIIHLKEMEKKIGINVFGENINDFFYLERQKMEMTFIDN
jgi:hypothetical protein